jgi:serine/threonine protein kinase
MKTDPSDRARDLFAAAVQHPPSERPAFLKGIAAVDPILSQELGRLLADEPEKVTPLEEPTVAQELHPRQTVTTAEPGTRTSKAPLSRQAQPRVEAAAGTRVGAYRIVHEIGRGGMGAVYLAVRDDDEFRKRVAVKLLGRGAESEDMVRRFRTERQILAGIDHPHIARLLDGGTSEEGLPYFVMEFIDGLPIDLYCDSHLLSVTERLKLFRQVCSAVQFAHQNLVVHRDIKPKNILVTADGTPKLLDFGIAKLLNPDLSGGVLEVTRLEERLMTPDYASPEQIRGEPITTASDIYSLGVLMYELLTGHRPYRLARRTMSDLTRAICEEDPARPSTIVVEVQTVVGPEDTASQITPEAVSRSREGSPERLRRRLAGDLDNIVLMAMRKEPERRYASAEQLSEDIRRHLGGLPVMARKDTVGYRASKFVQRNRAAVVGAALVAISLLAGVVVSTWLALVASEQRDAARREAEKAQQINAFVQEMLSAADPSRGSDGGRDVTVVQVLERAAALAEIDLSSQQEVQAAVKNAIGGAYFGLGLYDSAESLLRTALGSQERLLGAEHPDVALTRARLASLLATKGDLATAEPMYRESLRVLKAAYGAEHLEVANVLGGLGQLL